MFLIDDLLLAPAKALLFVFKEVAQRAEAEFLNDEGTRQELGELYMLLETGRISEQEFEQQEEVLVRRLEAIEKRRQRH